MANDNPETKPITLEEIFSRGILVGGNRAARITIDDEFGEWHSFAITSREHKQDTYERETAVAANKRKILEFLAKCNQPVSKDRLDKCFGNGNSGGKYGTALAELTREGKVTVIDREYADDPKKFD